MYCSECGHSAEGKFCSNCGNSLTFVRVDVVPEPPGGWHCEFRYEQLLCVPEVKSLLARHAAKARKGVSGEQWLQLYSSVIPGGVPLDKVAAIVQPLYAKWGISTGKQQIATIPAPIGRVLVRALCSLARSGQSLRDVQQGVDGCFITADLPSDLLALKGDMLITVRRHEMQTEVAAATKIEGQWFDWGKSRLRLTRLFEDLMIDPT